MSIRKTWFPKDNCKKSNFFNRYNPYKHIQSTTFPNLLKLFKNVKHTHENWIQWNDRSKTYKLNPDTHYEHAWSIIKWNDKGEAKSADPNTHYEHARPSVVYYEHARPSVVFFIT